MDLAAVTEQLYGLLPAEFTAARNAAAKDAAADDKALADLIRRLPKSSAAAWAVNMLVRHRSEDIAGILQLGASLRGAQEALDPGEMKALGRQRQALIAAIAGVTRDLVTELGNPIGEPAIGEVEQTVRAAMTDEGAAEAVRSGRLVRALASTGLEPPDLAGAVAGPSVETDSPNASARSTPTGRRPASASTPARAAPQRDLARARRAVDEAELRRDKARTDLEAIDDRLAELDTLRERLMDELDELQGRLAAVTRDLAAADRESRTLGRGRDRAGRAAGEAERNLARTRDAVAPEAPRRGSTTLEW